MLSGLIAVGALTALLAGIAGAWSPCGFSMVDTIGTALGDARRTTVRLASATFALGALLGGAATFGGLALLGRLLGPGADGVRDGLAAALALAAAVADWRGVKIAPQIRRQVPERWRWVLPLPLACGLYGLLLGLGFTTFVLTFAVWALAGISFAADSVVFGMVAGVAFGIGRALPVLWIAPRLGTAAGDRALERLALEPRLWLGMRRLDAIGLSVCAVLLGGSSAAAATAAYRTDPSAYGGRIAWQKVGGRGWLRDGARTARLPGRDPALGGGNLAYLSASAIIVEPDLRSAAPITVALPQHASVNALAVSAHWLVVRDVTAAGLTRLYALSLPRLAHRRSIAQSSLPGAIGRPTIEKGTVAWSFSSPAGSAIDAENLHSGIRTVLRQATQDVAYANPALDEGRLLYERFDRCTQEVLLGVPADSAPGHDRVLLSLPSTALRDPGYESGYIQDYNAASLCANAQVGGGGTITIGATALTPSSAYVSESPAADAAQSRIIALPLG